MLAATLLLVWVNLFLTAYAIAGGELYEQQNLEKQEAVPAVSGTGTGDAAGPSFEVECAKCCKSLVFTSFYFFLSLGGIFNSASFVYDKEG